MDQPQDNVLDAAEFAAAMHLLQQTMRGVPLPVQVLPPCLMPGGGHTEVRIPIMTKKELSAYKKLFDMIDQSKKGKLNGKI